MPKETIESLEVSLALVLEVALVRFPTVDAQFVRPSVSVWLSSVESALLLTAVDSFRSLSRFVSRLLQANSKLEKLFDAHVLRTNSHFDDSRCAKSFICKPDNAATKSEPR